MHLKKVAAFSTSLDFARRMRDVASTMDVAFESISCSLADRIDNPSGIEADLLVVDASQADLAKLADSESRIIEAVDAAMLLVVGEEQLKSLRLPVQFASDFACRGASDEEIAVRMRNLLWPGEEVAGSDFIRQGALTINLATYQVKVDGEPLDFTFLEYALLAFLVTHPGRTYSRDALLSRVWDFDYYGGSRTVDVHVRRIRAKLGPDLAQHLKTVRGVGYLWSI